MKKLILLSVLLFLFQIQVFPNIIIVDQSGGGNYTYIQEGINNADNGDTVLVYPGTYYENINYYGKSITVASLFLTTQDTIYISQTIINGNQNGSVVEFVSGEGLNSIIKGFSITNGFASYTDSIPGGGGIKCINSSPTIANNIIKENNCDLYIHGGGIYCEKSSSHILNNTISNNEGAYYGGGIFVSDTSAVLVKGNIIYNNSPDEIAETLTITYSDIQGGWAGTGNIDADPLFADPANGNFHLTWENFPVPDDTKSPCIDAGDPTSPLDPDSTIADMGAFYFNQIITSVEPLIEVNVNHKLFQNYPNPFSSETTISFYIKKEGNVNIIIFNNIGKGIRTLVNENQLAGEHSVVWDGNNEYGENMCSGIYFCKLNINNKLISINKMILL